MINERRRSERVGVFGELAGAVTVYEPMAVRESAGRSGLGAAFTLGSVFAIGWTPCIGAILGGILELAATSEGKVQGALLLVGYTLGLGIPFIVIAAFYDRSRTFVRFLVRTAGSCRWSAGSSWWRSASR